TAADVLKIMVKEYSYQMAVILYYSATGKEIFSKGEAKDTTFDISHPMFKTEQGQRLELIIKELSKPNPDERMDYNTAARLMAVMDNKQAFEAVMRKFHAPGFSDPALHAPAQTSTPGTANIMVALAAARE